MRKLVPLILPILGLLAGGGAGLVLRPAAAPGAVPEAPHGAAALDAGDGHDEGHGDGHSPPEDGSTALPDYVKLSNQFVVPVVEGGLVAAMVILSLSLEVTPGSNEAVYAREPRLRDAFLQVLFDHANAGGFRGSFTDGANLDLLRQALREAAQKVLGAAVSDVLIADIVRQDG